MSHKHEVIFIGDVKGEFGGTYPLRWCRICGTLLGFMSGGIAEMNPLMYKPENKELDYKFVDIKPSKKSKNVLGRGLIELSTTKGMTYWPWGKQ